MSQFSNVAKSFIAIPKTLEECVADYAVKKDEILCAYDFFMGLPNLPQEAKTFLGAAMIEIIGKSKL